MANYFRIALLFLISFGVIAACYPPAKEGKQRKGATEYPKPSAESKTDSLKKYLDEERARRLEKH